MRLVCVTIAMFWYMGHHYVQQQCSYQPTTTYTVSAPTPARTVRTRSTAPTSGVTRSGEHYHTVYYETYTYTVNKHGVVIKHVHHHHYRIYTGGRN